MPYHSLKVGFRVERARHLLFLAVVLGFSVLCPRPLIAQSIDELQRQYDQHLSDLTRSIDQQQANLDAKERSCFNGDSPSCRYLYSMMFHPKRLAALCQQRNPVACQRYDEYLRGAAQQRLMIQDALAEQRLKYQADRAQEQRDRWHEQALSAKGDSEIWNLIGNQLSQEGRVGEARHAYEEGRRSWEIYEQYRRK